VLWDKQQRTIVSNESSDIIRMLNSAFDGVGANGNDYYPEALRPEIDEWNALIYPNVNNGVYRAGFATTQAAYEEAAVALFATLDRLEQRLATRRYLTGPRLTEADVRLFTTLIRFDPVYYGHFKCNKRRIVDYPSLWGFVRDVYQLPGISDTVHIDFIKAHYYGSNANINPTRIVPIGPDIDYWEPHQREEF
jgi:putative glutathione S-transferase